MSILRANQSSRRRRRSGFALYVAVLATALLSSLLGLAALLVVRIERHRVTAGTDIQDARLHARSAVELALRTLNADTQWRSKYPQNVESPRLSLGPASRGTVSWILADSDGSLADPYADTLLRLRGVGRVGDAVQVAGIEFREAHLVYDALLCSTYATGNVTQSSTSTTNGGPFASGALFTVGGTILGDVEGSPVVLSAGTVSGTITSPGLVRPLPPATVWDTYRELATTIPYSSFPGTSASDREMLRNMISALRNPYGTTNSEGIYYIQVPAGASLSFSKSRIHATLLVELGEGASLNCSQSCLWDPPLGKNYAAMIVKAPGAATVDFKASVAALKENQAPTFNFNPPGDPYGDVSDDDTADQYPPMFRGLFHIIGPGTTTSLSANFQFTGVMITEGAMTLGANITVVRDPQIYARPPFGYSPPGEVTPVSGTWTWEAAP